MKEGLHETELAGVKLRIRVEIDHSEDCSDLRDPRGVHWVQYDSKWLDRRGGNRSHHRRWQAYRCNGISSVEHGDGQRYCKARIIVDDFGLSDVINAALA